MLMRTSMLAVMFAAGLGGAAAACEWGVVSADAADVRIAGQSTGGEEARTLILAQTQGAGNTTETEDASPDAGENQATGAGQTQ